MARYTGKLIVLEGIDGTGKTTHATKLAARYGLEHFREPGSVAASEAIRATILANKMSKEAHALLFIAARTEFVKERLIPALKAGKTVIMERYYFSTMAYQHGALPWDVFNKLHDWMPKPDKVILLECTPETAMARDVNPNDATNGGKPIEFFQDLLTRYRAVVKGHNCTIINANTGLDEVYKNIVRTLSRENSHIFGSAALT